jgi:hypothetical protein
MTSAEHGDGDRTGFDFLPLFLSVP